MLPVTWPKRGVTPAPASAQPEPMPPERTRAHELKPFEGLTHKPHCALCERDTSHPKVPPPLPPDSMAPTHRRPRAVDTSRPCCPHSDCDYRGWLGLGNLRANGHPSGGPWRQCHCTSCKGYFLETDGPIFHGKQTAVELIVRVLACGAEGLGIRATARVFEVDAHTVLPWLGETAEQLRAFSSYFLCDLHLEQWQLDEVYAVLRDLKAGAISDDEAIKRLERSPYWLWTAMDPTRKLLVVVDGGCRTLAMAQRVVHQVTQGLAPACVPRWLTDGLKDYATALLTHVGQWRQPERRQDKGPRPQPRWLPLPDLRYAQVVKSYRHPAGHRAAPGGLWLDHQHRVCRAPQPRCPPAGGGDRTPGQYPVPRRSRRAGSVGPVAGLAQFCLASRQFASAVAGSRSHQRPWFGEGVAALHTGDGGGRDRSRVVAHSGAVLPGAAVAATCEGVRTPWRGEAARGGGQSRRRASTRLASRASRGRRGPLGCHDRPLV